MLTLEELFAEPYASIVCYPRPSKTELKRRLNELERLGVGALEFEGEKSLFNKPILGKGCVGIVVIAYADSSKYALKIRRVDADRNSMRREAKLLKKANLLSLGPEMRKVSRNFLLMQFIEGSFLLSWLKKTRGKSRLRSVLRSILEQCFVLDLAGLDHGELSCAIRHIIVDAEDRPFLLDFESASDERKAANVTSVCQFLLLHGETATRIRRRLGKVDETALLSSLRKYKHHPSRENFKTLMETCGL